MSDSEDSLRDSVLADYVVWIQANEIRDHPKEVSH